MPLIHPFLSITSRAPTALHNLIKSEDRGGRGGEASFIWQKRVQMGFERAQVWRLGQISSKKFAKIFEDF
jgi:hypothetical protein